ncbi:hypothetical protein [Arthrobacter sp. 18067]|uniref:hypothetical protein n=1 Tax=Arthrobacter sp. 18067 TaxID=2681413 RepID=UPI00135AD1CC|nr:hypothetical protein [Arthrobacter sp. 18067]
MATDRMEAAVAAVLVVHDDGSHTFTGELPTAILDAPRYLTGPTLMVGYSSVTARWRGRKIATKPFAVLI